MNAARTRYSIDITIRLKTPWLVQGNEPGRFGLDATLMRDHKRRLILPGSLLAGRIQAAWNEMKKMRIDIPADTNIENNPKKNLWFGGEGLGNNNDNNYNLHARIWTNDLVITNTSDELLQSTRIKINETTEAVENGSLLLIEQTHKANETVTFTGLWTVYLEDNERQNLEHHLRAGLLWHSQLGAERSVGFGELVEAQITLEEAKSEPYPEQQPVAQKRLMLKVDRPLCIATRNRRGNVFESSDIITGGTLKGALAHLFQARYGKTISESNENSTLAKHFNVIRIKHAFPSGSQKRPCAIPLSLASVNGRLFDLAEVEKPNLVDGHAPAFFHDWKNEWSEINKARGWGETDTHLRVRTAIDTKQRTAEEGKLFAYQCKVPKKQCNDPSDETVWLADLILPDHLNEETRKTIWQELSQLLENGLGPIGKTNAFAATTFQDDLDTCWPQKDINVKNRIILMLNTPALLLASHQVADKKPQEIDLHNLYNTIFSELSKESLTLSHFYTSHSMSGGEFLWRRYINNMAQADKNYRPFVLTDAGSVFVLKINSNKKATAHNKITEWQKTGLPLPETVKKEHGEDWSQNPFIPQNGFGEIAVNLSHGFYKPDDERLAPCDYKKRNKNE